jgi:NAD+ kinase
MSAFLRGAVKKKKPRFSSVILAGKYRGADVGESLAALAEFLRARGCAVAVEAQTPRAAALAKAGLRVARLSALRRADLAIVVGGDGTFISFARRLAPRRIPLIGVNLGGLGFLTDIALSEMSAALAKVLDGDFQPGERMMLRAEVWRGERQILPARKSAAVNDIVVNRGDTGVLLALEVFINGALAFRQRSDGLIVSTPTGSTAYAMAAGGPIVQPELPSIALVPLCPHSLTHRPLVIAPDCAVAISLLKARHARLHLDGQDDFALATGDTIKIRRHETALTIFHPPGYDYFHTLRRKLRWGE